MSMIVHGLLCPDPIHFLKGPQIDNRGKLNIPRTLFPNVKAVKQPLRVICVFHNCPTMKLNLIFLLVMIDCTHCWHFLTEDGEKLHEI